MRKALFVMTLISLFFLNSLSFGQTQKYGIGLVIIEPTGLSAKAWLKNRMAIAGGIGWSSQEGHYLHLHVDFLFYSYHLAGDKNLDLMFYVGAGGKILFKEGDNAWLRFPLGMDFNLKKVPLNIFIEIVPSTNFDEFHAWGAIGVRYLFSP